MEIQQQEDNKKVTQSSINDVETTAPGKLRVIKETVKLFLLRMTKLK